MSTTNISKTLRYALWKAYNENCFYCNEFVEWTILHIDHLIPESLSTEKLEEIKQEYELDINFDLNAYYNLVPTHPRCNNRKSNIVFDKTKTLYFLGITKEKTDKISIEDEKLTKFQKNSRIIAQLETAIDNDFIDINEVSRVVNDKLISDWAENQINLSIPVEFDDELLITLSKDMNFQELYNKKLVFGGQLDSITLINDQEIERKISTLKEWKSSLEEGFYPFTNTDIKLSDNVSFLEDLIYFIEKAEYPKASFLHDPWLDIKNTKFLSPKVLIEPDNSFEEYINNGESINDLINQNLVKVNFTDVYEISLQYNNLELSMSEVFRADFNKDGLEDILVKYFFKSLDGSFGTGGTMALSRLNNKTLIEPIY